MYPTIQPQYSMNTKILYIIVGHSVEVCGYKVSSTDTYFGHKTVSRMDTGGMMYVFILARKNVSMKLLVA